MPVSVKKIKGKNLYKVVDASGKVHAKGTTKTKAEAQKRLLNMISNKKKNGKK
jgi:hypothetical protein